MLIGVSRNMSSGKPANPIDSSCRTLVTPAWISNV